MKSLRIRDVVKITKLEPITYFAGTPRAMQLGECRIFGEADRGGTRVVNFDWIASAKVARLLKPGMELRVTLEFPVGTVVCEQTVIG